MLAKADYLGAQWDAPTQDRFWSKVEKSETCWVWKGTLTPKGYGQFSISNRHFAAHRLLVVKLRGEAFNGLVCDHLCRNRACVNPAHIEIVPNRVNILRGDAPMLNRIRGRQVTHCPKGHPYTPQNTRYNPRGSRTCRACDRINGKRWTEKRRARAATTKGEDDE